MRPKTVFLTLIAGSLMVASALMVVHINRPASAAASATSTPRPTITPIPATPHPTPPPIPTSPPGILPPLGTPPPLPTGVPPGPPTGPPPTRYAIDFAGGPAITPRTAIVNNSTPTFTAQDATNFTLAHPPGEAHGTPITVVKVTFATSRDLVAQGAADLGVSPTRLLCYVQISGTFVVGAPPPGHAGTSHTAYYFFDALTGNYLGINIRD